MANTFKLIGPLRKDDPAPLWEADLTVEQESGLGTAEPVNQARTVFLHSKPTGSRHWPSAMLARCRVRSITVRLPAQHDLVLAAPDELGGVVSLLVQNPTEGDFSARAYLLHGDLPLDMVWHESEWTDHPARIPGFSKIAFIRLTADGLSFAGDCRLPWIAAPIRARFLLRCPFDDKGIGNKTYHVTLDRRDPAPDRLTAREAALAPFVSAFSSLRAILPSPDPRAAWEELTQFQRPGWQELELSREDIPNFHWRIANTSAEFHLDSGSLELRVTDSLPAKDPESQIPRRVSSIQPEWLITFNPVTKLLDLAVFAPGSPASGPRATWNWTSGGKDRLTLEEISTSDDAIATSLWVRKERNLPRPSPDRSDRTPLLYAFLPLEDGWAHWPVPNLVLEDYDRPQPVPTDPLSDEKRGLMSGAIAYEYHPGPETSPAQNPWSVTILQAEALADTSTWRFDLTSSPAVIERATTCLRNPALVFDGLLWLSARKPGVEDALPDLVEHLGHLRAIPLRSLTADDDFPAAFCIQWSALQIDAAVSASLLEARLAGWQMSLGNNPGFVKKATPFLHAYSDARMKAPLLFRRHPTLPFVQSLPLLQSQDPPSYPAASRELAVLEQPWREQFGAQGWIDDQQRWQFGSSNGTGWPATSTPPKPAQEWVDQGLAMASLTLPGLTLDPRNLSLPRGAFGLTVQYWYGLPYLDQLYALSQMPRDKEDEKSPLVPSRERKPLDRDSFANWWADLASHQFLARSEAAECLAPGTDSNQEVNGLIEPHPWPVKTVLDDSYPGQLTLTDSKSHLALVLARETGLRGLHGSFSLAGGDLRLDALDPGAGSDFVVIAGCMVAAQRADQYLRDQRGLYRLAATVVESGGRDLHVDTPLEYRGSRYLQRTMLQKLDLASPDEDWSFLMAGVALKDGVAFDRSATLSPAAEDANDPGARGVDHNFLAGHSWWLGTACGAPLKLCGLDVFALALDRVTFAADGTIELRLLIRLQLPVLLKSQDGPVRAPEQTQRSNCVLLTFAGRYPSRLALKSVEPAPAPGVPPLDKAAGEWPLTADEAGPIVTWEQVSFANNTLTFGGARLVFGLFGQNWDVALDPLAFMKSQETRLNATINYAISGITVVRASGKLMPDGDHRAELRLAFEWGKSVRLAIEQSCVLLGTGGLPATAAWISTGGSLPLKCEPEFTPGLGLQSVLSFEGPLPAGLQLLPGMAFSAESLLKKLVAGFAAVEFSAAPPQPFNGHHLPKLGLTAAAAELIVPLQWGSFLQRVAIGASATTSDVFGSSAGDLSVNFSVEWTGTAWRSELLLNGWMEVKNLISWPESLVSAPDGGELAVAHAASLLFEEGSADLPHGYEDVFAEITKDLRGGRYELRIEGHASDTGDQATNLALSRTRAFAVRNKLVRYIRDKFKQPEEDLIIELIGEPVAYGENRLAVLAYDDEARRLNRRVTLVLRPLSVRIPTAADPLHHDRHSASILFNQHALGGDTIGGGPAGSGILVTLAVNSWPFIAVVQHELTRIHDITDTGASIAARRRWTVAQEVRIARADVFAAALTAITQEDNQDTITGSRKPIGETFQWTLQKAWLTGAGGAAALEALAPALVVEASAPIWIRTPLEGEQPLVPEDESVLEYLPGGTLQASLTNVTDFGVARQGARPWLFLNLPFIGRLQPASRDVAATPALARDPVRSIRALGAATPAAILRLACREAAAPIWAKLRDFDDPEHHRFERLTEGVLEEGFYRYLHPAAGDPGDIGGFAAIMATTSANGPGRMTQPAALAAVFDASRAQYPPGPKRRPAQALDATLPPVARGKAAWFGQQAGVRFDQKKPALAQEPDWLATSSQAFFFPAFALRELWSASPEATFLAATALPVATTDLARNNQPVTIAVSPCTALGFMSRAPAQQETRLVTFGEVLGISLDARGDGRLRTLLSTVWVKPDASLAEDARRWAREAASELAPESAVVIVRLRSTVRLDDTAMVVTRFEHLIAGSACFAPTEPPGLRLRSDHRRLHFAETQASGSPVPDAARRFELAPPLTIGAQPIWTTELASETGARRTSLSALRLAVRTLDPHGPAVVGATDIAAPESDAAVLWWQTLWHQVAFDIDGPGRRLLPKGFRARARRGYGPAPSQLRMPDANALKPLIAAPGESWQAVLPAAVDCLLSGARPGAPFVVRPMTMTQSDPLSAAKREVAVGASVPVQHRFPRPVPLPANDAARPALAHQPWASFVAPAANHLDDPETFPDIAAFDLAAGPEYLLVRLRAVIQESRPPVQTDQPFEVRHKGGLILADRKTLAFEFSLKNQQGEIVGQANGELPDAYNKVRAALTDGTTVFPLKLAYRSEVPAWRAQADTPETLAALTGWIGKRAHGTILSLEIAVPPINTKVAGYRQVLRIPVQVCDPSRLRASLERRLIHFEDPAYDRSLASTPAQKLGELQDPAGLLRSVMLAVDRREYNSTSRLLGVFADKADSPDKPPTFQAHLRVCLVNPESGLPEALGGPVTNASNNTVFEIDLAGLSRGSRPVTLAAGDTLLIQIWSHDPATAQAGPFVEVAVQIVAGPVTPPPDHAYALLAAQIRPADGANLRTRCARFAWSPLPDRVELLDPDDLLRSAVRRRAVFRWLDAVVPNEEELVRHSIQKITPSGSTHWPAG
ncbi:OmpA family protein [Bradyrhizobium sp. SZCCHNS2005]|uniref:OmpA family protein n=1 Tax=Bradyrhizobium sp. SZCCHNS2005 TaxID=3057303 RepID=UPI0028E6DCD7|nr:OmpA family protein [Bradyrhizobium sp. SZCCHNS2005]